MSVATAPQTRVPLFVPAFDGAVSETAKELRQTVHAATAPGDDRSVDLRDEKVATVLERAIKRAAFQDGKYVSIAVYRRAEALLRSLPAMFPLPLAVVEADDEIALDWDEDRRRVLTVTLGTSRIGFSALIGPERSIGSAAFTGALPETLLFLLRRLYPDAGSADPTK